MNILSCRGSVRKRTGTTFTIKLPLGDLHLQKSEKSFLENDWPDMNEQGISCLLDSELLPFTETPLFTEAPKEFSILIIEDNHDLLNYLDQKFSENFDVYTAVNGNDALIQAYEKVPDLILTDVVLPGLSGKTITKN